MKKAVIFTLAVMMALGLCACRMDTNEPTTTNPVTEPPATTPSTAAPTDPEPIIDPTLDTNIPDPSVNDDLNREPGDNGSVMP